MGERYVLPRSVRSFVQRSKKLRVLAMSQFLSYKGDIFDTTVTFSKILEAAADADIGCSY